MPSATIVANTPPKRDRERQARGDDAAEHDRHDDERDRQRDQLGRAARPSRRARENSRSTSSSPPTSTFGASMPRSVDSTVDAACVLGAVAQVRLQLDADADDLAVALGPCCTDATPGIACELGDRRVGHRRALDDRGDRTAVRIELVELRGSPVPTRTTAGLGEVGVERRERARRSAATPRAATTTHVKMTSRGRRSAREVRRRSMRRACADPAEKSSGGGAIRRVHPWSDRRYRPRTRR